MLVNVTVLAALFENHSTRTSAGTNAGNTSKSVDTQATASTSPINQVVIETGALSKYIFVVSHHLYSL